jgi:hypothetical protein
VKSLENYYYEGQTQKVYGRNKGVYSEKEAEDLFVQALKDKGLYDKFLEDFKSSDQVLMRELAKTYLINLTNIADYKIDSLWLQTSDSLEDAFSIVRFYDYSIVRRKAPTVKLKYIGKDTLALGVGGIIGNYKGYDIINMEDTKYLEYGDVKEFHLGKYKEKDVPIPETNEFKIDLDPETLISVDQELIKLKVGEENVTITKFMLSYIKGIAVRDFSKDTFSTELYLQHKDHKYGIHELLETVTSVKVQYLETDGLLILEKPIDINEVEFQGSLKDSFEYIELDYKGYNGDTIETLRTYAPLVSSTKGIANSLQHYKVLTAFITDFYDTNPFKEMGVGVKHKVKVIDPYAPITFTVEDQTFTGIKGLTEELKQEVTSYTNNSYTISKVSEEFFYIFTNNHKAKNSFVCVSNLDIVETEPAIEPQCCVLMCPYVRYNLKEGIDELNNLTASEEKKVWEATTIFKGWGVDLRYYPAKPLPIKLKVEVQINDDITLNHETKEAIKGIFDSYSYKIGATIAIPELLVRLSNLKIHNTTHGSKFVINKVNADSKISGKVFKAKRDTYYIVEPEIVYTTWGES